MCVKDDMMELFGLLGCRHYRHRSVTIDCVDCFRSGDLWNIGEIVRRRSKKEMRCLLHFKKQSNVRDLVRHQMYFFPEKIKLSRISV